MSSTSAPPQQQQQEQEQEQPPENEAELMLRLQSQFGDMDLTTLLTTGDGVAEAAEAAAAKDASSSEESSLAEPSPEELLAWQASQFQKGQSQKEEDRSKTLGAVQKRREALKKENGSNINDKDVDDDWEQVAGPPNLQGQSSVFFPTTDAKGVEIVGVHPLLQQLSSTKGDADILGTAWKRLYSSSEGDGLSFFNLWSKLQGYPGPTVLLIGTVPSVNKSLGKGGTTGTVGFYTTSPWTESSSMTGSSDCFLFSFDDQHDQVQFIRPQKQPDDTNSKSKSNNKHYMYCHPSTMSLRRRGTTSTTLKNGGTTDGLVHGLGVGGSPSQPRLHLTESLEDCRALTYDSLFEAGDLLLGRAQETALNYFDVDAIEVWAVGGNPWIQESLVAQQAQHDIVHSNKVKARTVDKQQLLADFKSGLFNGGGGGGGLFGHHGSNSADRCDV